MKVSFTKTNIAILLFVVLLGIGGTTVWIVSHKTKVDASRLDHKHVYSCPMHPSIVSERPGSCPVCHMDLQKVEEGGRIVESGKYSSPSKEGKILFYRHPHKPSVTSPVPAKDEMGMDFVPVLEEEESVNSTGDVEGRAGFTLSPSRQQLIGVTRGKVALRNITVEIRASGKAAFDPDLFTAIEEYRQALLSASQMKDIPYEGLRTQAKDLVESAKTKLKLLGLTDSQIRKLSSGRVSPMSLLLPKGNVWIYAEVFEYELPMVKEGQEVEATSPALPGKRFTGKLTSISPIVNPQTRTARVRALIPDPKGDLRPDTFVNVRILASLGEKLVVPQEAVLHSGEEDFVFVLEDKGRFTPRKVTLGVKTKDFYEVLSGLTNNETVVTSANFLIDSESRLRGVLKHLDSSKKINEENFPSPNPHPGHGGSQ